MSFRTLSYKETLKRLKDERVVCVFAQGTRLQEIDIKSAKQGAAMFALKSGMPVVPVNISGSYRLFGSVKVRYGLEVTLDEYKGAKVKSEILSEITEKLMEKVSELGK